MPLLKIMKAKQKYNTSNIERNNHCKKSELESIVEANYNEAIRIQNKKFFIQENLDMILEYYDSLSEDEVEMMVQIILRNSERI